MLEYNIGDIIVCQPSKSCFEVIKITSKNKKEYGHVYTANLSSYGNEEFTLDDEPLYAGELILPNYDNPKKPIVVKPKLSIGDNIKYFNKNLNLTKISLVDSIQIIDIMSYSGSWYNKPWVVYYKIKNNIVVREDEVVL